MFYLMLKELLLVSEDTANEHVLEESCWSPKGHRLKCSASTYDSSLSPESLLSEETGLNPAVHLKLLISSMLYVFLSLNFVPVLIAW